MAGLVDKGVKGLLQTNSGVTLTASGAQVTVNKDIGLLFQNSNITQNIYHIYIYATIERGSSQTVNTYVHEVRQQSDCDIGVASSSVASLKDFSIAQMLARQRRKVALFTRLAVSCLARLSSVWFC